jgi:ribonucleoside-diphosphate reductase beta chain
VFSGAGEGVSLFSSFAVLLSLNLTGRFKGIAQIISWSALDEQQHSDTGIKLFRQLTEENPLTAEESKGIAEGFEAVISNEFSFLEKIFEGRTLNTIQKSDVREYILYRANDRLARLGVPKVFSNQH